VLSSASSVSIGGANGSPARLVNTGSTAVTAPAPAQTAITLSATIKWLTTYWGAYLKWSGATTTTVDLYRNGAKIANSANDGAWNQAVNAAGTYSYKVCNAGTSTCSAESTVTAASPTGTPTAATITLTASTRKFDTYWGAYLKWSGASGTTVDIYRNGVKAINTTNDGAWNQALRTAGTYTFKLCNAGTTVCSPDVSVVAQ
jgi:hypothetical protein